MWSDKEIKWLKRADRLFKDKPDAIMLYSCDGTITACKISESCRKTSYCIEKSNINCCCVISDVHDDMGFGEPSEEMFRS